MVDQIRRTRRWNILLVMLIAITIVIFSVLIFLVWRNNSSPKTTKNDAAFQLEGWDAEQLEILQKTYEIAERGETTSFADAVNFLTQKIESTSDNSQRFDLQLDLVGLYASAGEDPETALGYLKTISEDELSLKQKTNLYSSYSSIYRMLKQDALADEYLEKFYTAGKILTEEDNE